MSASAITKEEYLDKLAESAVSKLLSGVKDESARLLLPQWKKIIIKELSPLLRLI